MPWPLPLAMELALWRVYTEVATADLPPTEVTSSVLIPKGEDVLETNPALSGNSSENKGLPVNPTQAPLRLQPENSWESLFPSHCAICAGSPGALMLSDGLSEQKLPVRKQPEFQCTTDGLLRVTGLDL
ncbi:hypothetical protein H920_01998 [Fukomys damarensis]|uniref:Uncharacterized protein n=1 Tax=Fukomys damarensis TaxID=885580 RepID=A0A091DWM8_FUKDA|nr:hypothetical protein H920_01998 [Fukomys damarensis]